MRKLRKKIQLLKDLVMGNLENLKHEIVNFREAFCPYGYLDIQQSVSQAMNAGFDGDWAFDQIEQFCGECGLKFSAVDPCYIVLDSILQQARTEIENLCDFDICNDAGFYVYANFMCSSFESGDDDRERLQNVLSLYASKLEQLSVCTRYWLKENGIEIESLGE